MLRGAVTFGEDFEQTYMKRIFDLDKGMTQAISHFSSHQDAKAVLENGRFRYTVADQQNAEKKIRSFYAVTIWALVAVAAGILLISNLAFAYVGVMTETDKVIGRASGRARVWQHG